MSRKINTVISSEIDILFEEWVKIFESKEADLRHSEFDIKLLFIGCNIDHPQKVIILHKALQENIQKFVQVNSEWIKNLKVYFSTKEESS